MTKNMNRGEKLHSEVRAEILRMIDADGKKEVCDKIRRIVANSKMDPKRFQPSEMLGVVQKKPDHRFGQLWHRLLEALARKQGSIIDVPCDDCGTEERQQETRTADEPSFPKQPEPERGTAIVRHIGDLEFRLPSEDLTGAMAARITLTELARKLGYEHKQDLKRLAERNASVLAEFGLIGTVPISIQGGNGSVRWTEEPSYNVDQAVQLGLASETVVGRAMRVTLWKAHKELLAEFERVVAQPAGIDYQAMSAAFGSAMAEQIKPLLSRIEKLETSRRPTASASAVEVLQNDTHETKKGIHELMHKRAGITARMSSYEEDEIMGKAYNECAIWIADHSCHNFYRDRTKAGGKLRYLEWASELGILHLFRAAAMAVLPVPKAKR